MIQVVTISSGLKYSPDYAEKLAAGVERNLHVDHAFSCLCDSVSRYDLDPKKLVELPRLPLEGWWWKLWLFSPQCREIFEGRGILWIDLDTVILDEIDFLVGGDEFLCLQNVWFPSTWGSGVMWIPPGWGKEIWDEFSSKREFYMRQPGRSDCRMGDQGFIYDCCCERKLPRLDHDPRIQLRWPGKVLSYKAEILGQMIGHREMFDSPQDPAGASIVYFHGPPRPHEVVDSHPWMREHWGVHTEDHKGRSPCPG